MTKSKFIFFCFLLIFKISFTQNRETDSLFALYKNNGKHDTIRLKALQNLGWSFAINLPDSAITLTNILLKEARLKKLPKFEANALSNLGVFYKNKGNYAEALLYMNKALEMRLKSNDKKGIAVSYNSIGNVYSRLSDYQKAIDYHIKVLNIAESINDISQQASTLNNIGNIYFKLKNYKGALSYYNKSYLLKLKSNNKNDIASSLLNISSTYDMLLNLDSAKLFEEKSLQLYKETGNNFGINSCNERLGEIYLKQGNYDTSLAIFNKVLEFYNTAQNTINLPMILIQMGQIFEIKGDLKKSQEYTEKALAIAIENKDKPIQKDCYDFLYANYKKQSKFKESLEAFENYNLISNSLYNIENEKALLQKTIQHDYEKKAIADSLVVVEEKQINKVKLQNEKNLRYALYAGILLCLLFGLFMFNRFRITQKQKKIIELKEKETSQQKLVIEEKQKEIVDSITYAKRLQDAILPSPSDLKKKLSDFFLLYIPKDIVAGDFYWMHACGGKELELRSNDNNKSELILIAAADCTGHGVPGAMVSVVCSNALNRSTNEFGLTEPGKILDKTRELVLETFSKSERDVKDGMDISMVSIEFIPESAKLSKGKLIIPRGQNLANVIDAMKKYKIQWAGANNPLLYIKNGELIEITAQKQAIGKTEKPSDFITHSFELSKGDCLYLFTDGYADQFGGQTSNSSTFGLGKKLKYKQLKQLILSNNHLPMSEQHQLLTSHFNQWKGHLEQVDDVCIIGIRI